MQMKLEYQKGILFVRIVGPLTHECSYNINTKLIPKILENKIKYLVFNLYEVTDIDSFGLDALLNTKCAIKSNKGKICLCEIPNRILKKINHLSFYKTSSELNAMNMIGDIC